MEQIDRGKLLLVIHCAILGDGRFVHYIRIHKGDFTIQTPMTDSRLLEIIADAVIAHLQSHSTITRTAAPVQEPQGAISPEVQAAAERAVGRMEKADKRVDVHKWATELGKDLAAAGEGEYGIPVPTPAPDVPAVAGGLLPVESAPKPKEYAGWTCGKCNGPVAGRYSKCEACGHGGDKVLTPHIGAASLIGEDMDD